jgi:hypothetical protein
LKPNSNIYISHHPSDLKKAKDLVKFLAPLGRNLGVEVSCWESIMPGSNIEMDAFNRICNSDLIICLISADYLADCVSEIGMIKASKCFQNEKVIPVPISPCLWEEVFGGLMPLPRDSSFRRAPFDDSGFWLEVVCGVKEILQGKPILKKGYIPIMPARADSTIIEQSQEHPTGSYLKIPLHPDDILIPITGDSMSPIFEDGDIVIGRKIQRDEITQDKIERKKFFVIRTKTHGTFLKCIGAITKTNIVLVSLNSTHKNITLEGEEIDSIFLVVRSVKVRDET